MTVAIDMGFAGQGATATLDLEELLATRLLVQGNSGSGKSHLLRRLLEQSAPWVQQVVIDPEGDFVSLADGHGHLVIDAAAHTEATITTAAARVRTHRVSVVLNLENLDAEGQMRFAAAFLGGLFDADRDCWTPVLVVVDEAQLFAPAAASEVADDVRKLSLAAMTNLMCRGRKRGLAGVIATQRLAKLAKNVAAEASNFLMGRTFLDIDMARAADLLGMERRQADMFRDLQRGQFMALGPALCRRPMTLRIGAVTTASRSAAPSLSPPPMTAPEDARELVMAAMPEPSRPPPRRPAQQGPDLLTQLSQSRPAAVHQPAEDVLDFEVLIARQRQMEAILREMMVEADAGFRPAGVLYQDFLVRCRIAAIPGKPLDMQGFRPLLASARAGITGETSAHQDWPKIIAAAQALPEEAQGVFLLLAQTALLQAPCPSDATIARVYGTHSTGRAKRLLGFLEEQSAIVCCPEPAGRRSVAIPGLGWRTTPGEPHATEAA
jgi:hypothetical protein